MDSERWKRFIFSWAAATLVSLVAGYGVPFYDAPALVVFGMDALIIGLVQWALSRTDRPSRPTVIAASAVTSALFLMGAVMAVVGVDRQWPMHIFLGGALFGSVFGLLHGAAFVSARSILIRRQGGPLNNGDGEG